MCVTCGCSDHVPDSDVQSHAHGHSHSHAHGHSHAHAHAHEHVHSHAHAHPPDPRRIRLEQDVLEKNNGLARENRRRLDARGVLALNFVSAPGSGKTTLLERAIADLRGRTRFAVLEGDQATDRDAERIRRAGARAVQINTGTGCHLDAAMVEAGIAALDPERGSVLAIENVGNLVCPALFDLGEHARLAVLSVTEGGDKPLKYPYLFRGSQVTVVNKADLLPYVDFDLEEFRQALREVNPDATVFVVSAKTGQGLGELYTWVERERAALPLPVEEASV